MQFFFSLSPPPQLCFHPAGVSYPFILQKSSWGPMGVKIAVNERTIGKKERVKHYFFSLENPVFL